jgi:hypothetical protein
VFGWLAEQGGIAQPEMLRTFNCGIGMIMVADEAQADDIMLTLAAHGEQVVRLGKCRAFRPAGTGQVLRQAWLCRKRLTVMDRKARWHTDFGPWLQHGNACRARKPTGLRL